MPRLISIHMFVSEKSRYVEHIAPDVVVFEVIGETIFDLTACIIDSERQYFYLTAFIIGLRKQYVHVSTFSNGLISHCML